MEVAALEPAGRRILTRTTSGYVLQPSYRVVE